MTRSPYRRKNHGCKASIPAMRATDAATKIARKGVGSMKSTERAVAVPRSVTKVAAMMTLPISVFVRPVSTRTA
jgi:hypothetical protein